MRKYASGRNLLSTSWLHGFFFFFLKYDDMVVQREVLESDPSSGHGSSIPASCNFC